MLATSSQSSLLSVTAFFTLAEVPFRLMPEQMHGANQINGRILVPDDPHRLARLSPRRLAASAEQQHVTEKDFPRSIRACS